MSKNLTFVIQKHDATSLHYDFRLEIGKVMPSWSIPRGPTLDPQFKRLALETTDHDLSYKDFEGVIPEGSYGAGPVMVWDEGDYIPEEEVTKGQREKVKDYEKAQQIMKEGLKKGELKFFLEGKKIKGSFALIKTKGFPPGKSDKAWLLIKHQDAFVQKDYDAKDYDFSAKTKRSLKEIADSK